MKDLKPHKDDIPDITDLDWRLLAYKGTEMTARGSCVCPCTTHLPSG